MHRRFAVSHYPHSPCHSPCQRRELFGLRICQISAKSGRPAYLPDTACVSASSSAGVSAKASATDAAFPFFVRSMFVFARAALCPVASLTNLQQQKSMFKIWPPPAETVGMVYISASRCITSRRVNAYKETVGRFGGFKAI